MKPVSGYMMLLNEAPFVQNAVRSILPQVDELMIFDLGSTDGTLDMVRDLARDNPVIRLVEENQQAPRYSDGWNEPVRRNWYVDTLKHDWVLTIDGDEWLSAGVDLFRRLDSPITLPTINLVSTTHYILSEQQGDINFLYYPDRHIRFFNRAIGHYSGQKRHSRIINKLTGQLMVGVETDAVIWHYNAMYKERRKVLAEYPGRFVLLPLSQPLPAPWTTL